MKRNVIKSYLPIRFILSFSGMCIILLVYSCAAKNGEDHLLLGPALITVNIEGNTFTDGGTIENAPGSNNQKKSISISHTPEIQRSRLPFNKDFDLLAELTPIFSSTSGNLSVASLGNRRLSSFEQGDLLDRVMYKVVVYTENGDYVTERNYVHKDESSTTALVLNGGTKYTFIVYSMNKVDYNYSVTFSDPNNKTLATSSVGDMSGNIDDFMYFRKDMIVSGNGPNYLNIILKHMFSQVRTSIDAAATGYNITALSGHFRPNYANANAKLSDGTITRTGGEVNAEIQFPNLNNSTVQSFYTQINSDVDGTGFLTLSSLTVGPMSKNGLNVSGLSFTPGVKYNLKIKLVPNDGFITHEDQPAVRIGGRIWMRHNLGANTAVNADQIPSIQALHGNYYQWGRKNVVANASTPIDAIVGWESETTQPANLWNSGTEINPIKTSADPCPSGYRIPTITEYQALVDATVGSHVGTWNEGTSNSTNFSAAKVLTSKANANVRLTLPITGNRSFNNGSLTNRGGRGFYWSSSSNNNRYNHLALGLDEVSLSNSIADWAFPLRCIAIQ